VGPTIENTIFRLNSATVPSDAAYAAIVGAYTPVGMGLRVEANSVMTLLAARTDYLGATVTPRICGFENFHVNAAAVGAQIDAFDASFREPDNCGVLVQNGRANLYGCDVVDVATGSSNRALRVESGAECLIFNSANKTLLETNHATFLSNRYRKVSGSDTTGSSADIVVFSAGQIALLDSGTLGGINIDPNSWTRDGFIRDARSTAPSVFIGVARATSYTVATVPSASLYARGLIYVSDGAAGQPIIAFSDGTNWLRCDTRGAISAT
jgi:hypothetical protein